MINLLLGAPGGGKSYEATVYHILPALDQGRKVITNLPLNLDVFAAIDHRYAELIEFRTATKKTKTVVDWDKAQTMFQKFGLTPRITEHNNYPFSNFEDYGDPWRHSETERGALYVIDECHIALPVRGTPVKVEEWYSMHRHEGADVLLITQSHGKLNRAVKDLVQLVYRVRKNTALGSETSYVRKVQDGIRGEVVNTSVRKYEEQYFKYYKSHTRTQGSVKEASASDIVPIWKHWTFKASVMMLGLFLFIVFTTDFYNPLSVPESKKLTVSNSPVLTRPLPDSLHKQTDIATKQTIQPQSSTKKETNKLLHPYDGLGIHIIGSLTSKLKPPIYMVSISQNGQILRRFTNHEFERAGYTFTPISDCSAKIAYQNVYTSYIRCDSMQVDTKFAMN